MRSTAGVSLPTIIAAPLMAAGLIAIVWGGYYLGQRHTPDRLVSSGPQIEEVRTITKLAVLRIQVANVIEGTNQGAKAAVLVKGDADIVVDLDPIEIVNKDEKLKTATLVLPTPRVDRPRVDHARTRIYEMRKTGLAAFNPFADPRASLLSEAMRAAQEEVESAASNPKYVVQAQEQAEILLRSFYETMGWTITIEWK